MRLISTCKLLLTLPVLLVLAAPSAPAQTGQQSALYRVEVIVFTHRQGQPDRHSVAELRDFSSAIDPRTVEEPEEQLAALPIPASGETDGPDPVSTRPRPLDYAWSSNRSGTMEDVWNRLARSNQYEPVARQIWYQPAPRQGRTRLVRFHNERTIREDRPDTEPSRSAPDPEPEEPGTSRRWYQLDGSVRLSRRQYFHLGLDLEWREEASAAGFDKVRLDRPSEFLVHRLRQSRTVRPGRLEYFDSAWLGAVVLITRYEEEEDAGE